MRGQPFLRPIVIIAILGSVSVFSPYWSQVADAEESAIVGGEVSYQLDHNVVAGEEKPTLTLQAHASLSDVQIEIKRQDGHIQSQTLGSLRDGQSVDITIDQPVGTFRHDATVQGRIGDEVLTIEFDFDVTVSSGLDIDVVRDEIDLGAGKVPIRINQAVDRVEIEVLDGQGRQIVDTTQSFGGRQGRLDVQWESEGDPAAVRLKVHYGAGSWYEYILEPFWVEIPEQVINFETGSASIDEEQAAKLEMTRDRIREAIDELGEREANVRLYVAGYTDTVGSAANNLRLSTRRAQSIATWFRNHGLEIPIYYQGFGQQVLAVDTPDQTAEERNRRAVYILGNVHPPTSEQIPHSNWQRLR